MDDRGKVIGIRRESVALSSLDITHALFALTRELNASRELLSCLAEEDAREEFAQLVRDQEARVARFDAAVRARAFRQGWDGVELADEKGDE